MTEDSSREKTPVYIWVLAAALLLWMVVVITLSQWQMAPTFDEQNHVTRGISVLRTGDFRLCFHHPPFANVLEGLPVAWHRDTHFTTAMPSWNNLSIWNASNETIWQLSKNGVQLIQLARLPVLVFVLVLALVVFLWSKSLFGPWGGLLSLGLLALDPNMLAHGGLATTDIPAVSTILLAMFLLRRYIFAPTRANLCFAGIAAGVALATKFSALILIPVTGLLLLLVAFLPPHRPCPLATAWMSLPYGHRVLRVLKTCVLLGLVAGLVVWGIYGFKVEPLGAKSGKPLSAHASFIKRIPVPGKQYFRGLKTVKGEAGDIAPTCSVRPMRPAKGGGIISPSLSRAKPRSRNCSSCWAYWCCSRFRASARASRSIVRIPCCCWCRSASISSPHWVSWASR